MPFSITSWFLGYFVESFVPWELMSASKWSVVLPFGSWVTLIEFVLEIIIVLYTMYS